MDINRTIISGRLTKDPDLRSTGGGLSVCKMRIANNTRKKNSATGDWEDKPNYFNVTVFGRSGENCGKYLSKGSAIAIDGRLEWSEWEAEGQKRQSVDIVAENVQFLGAPGERNEGNGQGNSFRRAAESDIPADTSDISAPVAAGADDDDIPF